VKNEFIKNWETQLKKGLLPYFVLQALEAKECYGYELIQHLRDDFNIEVTESTMYPLLTRLQKEELLVHKWVEQPTGIPRKYYFISDSARANLAAMQQSLKEILQTHISK
jgi:PadR family transcriptional regulator PadR